MYYNIYIYIYIYINKKSDEIAPSIITLSQTLFIYFNIAGDNLEYFNTSLLPTFIHYMNACIMQHKSKLFSSIQNKGEKKKKKKKHPQHIYTSF